jgi:hypothetical protein
MAKDEKREERKPQESRDLKDQGHSASAAKVMQPTPGQKSPALTKEGALPQALTEAQRTEVLARVRGVLPDEAEALEAHFKYTDARPVVPSSEKTARDAEVQALNAWKEQVKSRAKELPAHLSYWVTLWESEHHKANPGERQIPSAEYLARKVLDHLLLTPEPDPGV